MPGRVGEVRVGAAALWTYLLCLPQQSLYILPEPHGHLSLGFGISLALLMFSTYRRYASDMPPPNCVSSADCGEIRTLGDGNRVRTTYRSGGTAIAKTQWLISRAAGGVQNRLWRRLFPIVGRSEDPSHAVVSVDQYEGGNRAVGLMVRIMLHQSESAQQAFGRVAQQWQIGVEKARQHRGALRRVGADRHDLDPGLMELIAAIATVRPARTLRTGRSRPGKSPPGSAGWH